MNTKSVKYGNVKYELKCVDSDLVIVTYKTMKLKQFKYWFIVITTSYHYTEHIKLQTQPIKSIY